MGGIEDKVRADILTKFGSVPKMAKDTGMAATTIYHALDRGLDNTTSKTKEQIINALYSDEQRINYAVVNLDSDLTSDERELIKLFRSLPDKGKHAVLAGLKDFAKQQ